MLSVYRPDVDDAKRVADAAFDRLGDRMVAAGLPRTAHGMDFRRWAADAWRVAPAELAAFVDAAKDVQRAMAMAV